MNTLNLGLVLLISLTAITACDAESEEAGATLDGTGSTSGETLDGTGSTSGETLDGTGSTSGETGDTPLDGCEAALTEEDCALVPPEGTDGLDVCRWVDVHLDDAACGAEEEVQSRCVRTAYEGDGCIPTQCNAAGENLFSREVGGIVEWIATSEAGCLPGGSYRIEGFENCSFGLDAADELGPACQCACEARDGVVPGQACDPLADTCPDAFVFDGPSAQACVPREDGTGWLCELTFPDDGNGEACNASDDEPTCVDGELCLPADGLGIPSCDGEEDCCTRVCDVTAGDSCPENGQVCSPLYPEGEAPVGYENVGVCRLP